MIRMTSAENASPAQPQIERDLEQARQAIRPRGVHVLAQSNLSYKICFIPHQCCQVKQIKIASLGFEFPQI